MQTKINQRDSEGRKQGYWEFYATDIVHRTCWFKDGKKCGTYTEYFSDGSVSYKGEMKNGMRHGYWEDYFVDGEIRSKGCYYNDKKFGLWIYSLHHIDSEIIGTLVFYAN